ncbi:MAG: hypothetical protein K0U98_23590 [Deltaproteobacteria bacterium]|nr:hypothetical protein [Deltaproteobacteria bacterium]
MKCSALRPLMFVLALLLAVPEAQAAQSWNDQGCLSTSNDDPFFTLAISRKSFTRQIKRTSQKGKETDLGESSYKWKTSTQVNHNLDHAMIFDSFVGSDAFASVDSDTLVKRYSTKCFKATLSLYDVQIGLGSFLYGFCEPIVSSSGDADVRVNWDYSPGVNIFSEFEFQSKSAISLNCDIGIAYVEGGIHGDLRYGIETDTSSNTMERYLDLDVYATAEAGTAFSSGLWTWESNHYNNRLYKDIVSY